MQGQIESLGGSFMSCEKVMIPVHRFFYLWTHPDFGRRKILNSVGCYQLEKLGPNIIENIKGDFFNVMGFPLFPFLTFLKKHKTTNKTK